MGYFDHPFISNSDLKKFKKLTGGGYQEPANLERIYSLGTIFHKTILEPHRITEEEKLHPDYELAKEMGKTFFKDEFCRKFILAPDFQREMEFYTENVIVGPYMINARAKCDGFRTRLKWINELKGLSVDTEKQFREAIHELDYDQGVAHYMLTTGAQLEVIVGISKKRPERMFKYICKQHDEFYLGGEQKIIDILGQLRELSPDDVQLAA